MSGFAEFDNEFDDTPPQVKPQFPSDQSKKVPAGEYTVELIAGKAKEGASDIYTFCGVIVSDGKFKGWHLEKNLFFNKKEGTAEEKAEWRRKKLSELVGDLSTLGFDVELWTKKNGRPFSEQLTLASEAMKGARVKMRKKGDFVNIDKRLEDGLPVKFGPEELATHGKASASAKPDTPFGVGPTSSGTEEVLPF